MNQFYELDIEDLPFANLAFENLVYLDEKGDYDFEICEGISINTEDGKFLPNPGEGVNLRNSTKEDRDLFEETISIFPMSPKLGHDVSSEYVKVEYNIRGNFDFKNSFNLQNFPFDKQILKFQNLLRVCL